MAEKEEEQQRKIEAILFAAGKKLSLDDIARLTRIRNRDEVLEAIEALKKEYEQKEGSLIIDKIEQDDEVFWKLTVKSNMIPFIKKLITKTELKKSVIETLAYIAYKYPIKQSDLIKVRSNKAYEHLSELEKAGYISRQRYGRTKVIKLTDKFFDYFDLPPEKLKDQFKDFAQLEKAIEEKEEKVEKMIEEHKKKAEEEIIARQEETKEGEKLEPDLEQMEIDLIDKEGHKKKLRVYGESAEEEKETAKVKTYEGIPSGNVEVIDEKKPEISEVEEKLGKLDVIDEPIPSLEKQIKEKEKKKKQEKVGKLEVFKEEGEKGETEEETAPEAEETEEENVEFTDKYPKEEEKPAEPIIKEEEKEPTIEDEMELQKEKLKPDEDAKFGKGFGKEVNEYMEKKAEVRAEEIMHPKGDEEKQEETNIAERIKMPAIHKTEKEEEGEEEEDVEEKKEDFIEKKESVIETREEEKTAELPPMDSFEEEEEKEKEGKKE